MNKIIFIHIKVLRGNFFLIISDYSGKLIFNKSCGMLGFKNINKRSKDAFQMLLSSAVDFLRHQALDNIANYNIFIKIEGAKKHFMKQINNQFFKVLKTSNLKIFGIKLINKVAHNGCRKPYFNK